MYVVLEAGGMQFIAKENETLVIPKIKNEVGEKVTFDKILLYKNDEEILVGKPYLSNVKVEAEVIAHKKLPKVVVFKFKRRKNYKRTKGHRQPVTEIKITSITKE